MSTHSDLWGQTLPPTSERIDNEQASHRAPSRQYPAPYDEVQDWDLRQFAQQQVAVLVQQVFLSGRIPKPQQVVFSSIEPWSGTGRLCAQASEVLATMTEAQVCLVDAGDLGSSPDFRTFAAQPLRSNLRTVSGSELCGEGRTTPEPSTLARRLMQFKREFDYTVIHAPSLRTSRDAIALAQMSGGMVLVLQAHATRRSAALQMKEILDRAGVRLLGTVLAERKFPIPESLYRRL